jgi:hypothetical protein
MYSLMVYSVRRHQRHLIRENDHDHHDRRPSKNGSLAFCLRKTTLEMNRPQELDKNEAPADVLDEQAGAGHENASLLALVTEWAGSSSVQGVPHVLDRVHFRLWKRITWGVLVCACFGVMTWQLVVLVNDYLEYTVNTSTDTIAPNSLPFPQVTVCNGNLYDTYLQNITGITEPSNEEELIMISTKLTEFISYTEFNSKSYEGRELENVWTPIITPGGLCFKFETDVKVLKPGFLGGLHFRVWLGQEHYMRTTEAAGLAVFITQPGNIVNDQTPLTMVPPGVDCLLGITLYEYERERDHPWSRCNSAEDKYTQDLCRSECLFEADRETCSCRPIGDPASPGMRYCNSTDWENCLRHLNETEILSKCKCSLPPCSQKLYPPRYASWAYSEVFLQDQVEKHGNTTSEEFLANFVAVTVNYDVIQSIKVTESKAMSFAQLLSSIGGTMGLFGGISAIGVFEIFGDLLLLRMLPRLWGDRSLYGLGSTTS